MSTSIFVNFPTTDLERAKAFYTSLGCEINPLFTDENAACIVWDENIYFMVLTKEYFATFTDKQIIDPKTHAQASHRAEPRLPRGRRRGARAGPRRRRQRAAPGAGLRLHVLARPGRPRRQQPSVPLHGARRPPRQGPEAYLAEQGGRPRTA